MADQVRARQGRQKTTRRDKDKDTSLVVHEKWNTQLLNIWTKRIVPENCNQRGWSNRIQTNFLHFFEKVLNDRDLQDKQFYITIKILLPRYILFVRVQPRFVPNATAWCDESTGSEVDENENFYRKNPSKLPQERSYFLQTLYIIHI